MMPGYRAGYQFGGRVSSVPAPRGGFGGAPVINRPPGANIPIPAMPGGGGMPLSQMLRMGTAFQQGAGSVRSAPAMQSMEERTAGSMFPGLQMQGGGPINSIYALWAKENPYLQEGGPVEPSGGGGGDVVGYRDVSAPTAAPPIAGGDALAAMQATEAPAMSPYATGYGGPRQGEAAQSYQAGGIVGPNEIATRDRPMLEHAHENIINRRMLIRHAQTDRPKAKRLLLGLKREHNGLRMHAAVALARRHDDHGIHLINHAATKIPDGAHTHFHKVGPDHFVARVYHKGQHDHALLNRGQMLQYATGPAGGFDHTLDNGVHKNLHILTTMSHLHDPVRARMGYAGGGGVPGDLDNPLPGGVYLDTATRPYKYYQEGGEVSGDGGTVGAGDGTITGPQMSDEIVKELERQKQANPEFFKQPAGGDETPVDPAGQPGSTYPSDNPLERQALPGDPEGGPAAKRGTSERAGAPPIPKQDLRDPAIPPQGSTAPPTGSQTREVEGPPKPLPGPEFVKPAEPDETSKPIPTSPPVTTEFPSQIPKTAEPPARVPEGTPAPPGFNPRDPSTWMPPDYQPERRPYRGPQGPSSPNYVPPGGNQPQPTPSPFPPGDPRFKTVPPPGQSPFPPGDPRFKTVPGTPNAPDPNAPVQPGAGGGGSKLPVVLQVHTGGIDQFENPEKYGQGRRGYHGPVDYMGSTYTPLQPGEMGEGQYDASITGKFGARLNKPLNISQIEWDRMLFGDGGGGRGGRRRRKAEGGPVMGYQEGGKVEEPAPSNGGGGGSLYDSNNQFEAQTEQQAQPGFKADLRELMSGREAGAAGDVKFPSEFSKSNDPMPAYGNYPPGHLSASGQPSRTEEPGEYARGGLVQQHDRNQAIIRGLIDEARREHGFGRKQRRRGYQEGGEVYNEPDVYSQVGTPWDYTNGTGAGAASQQELADARIAERNLDAPSAGDFLVRQAQQRPREPGAGGELGPATEFGQAGDEGTQVADFSRFQWPAQDFSSEIYMGPGGGGRRRHRPRGGGGGERRVGGEGGDGDQGVTLPSQEELAERESQGGSPAGVLPRQAGAPLAPDTRTQEEKEQDIYDARQRMLQPKREAQQRDIATERLRQISQGIIRPGDPLVNPYDQEILRRFPMGGGSEGPWGEVNTRSNRSYAALDAARSRWNRKYVLGVQEADQTLTNQPRGGGSFVAPFSKYPAGRDVMPSDQYGRSPAAQAEQGARPYTRDIPSPQIMSGDEYAQRDRESQRQFGNIPGPAPPPTTSAGALPPTPGTEDVVPMDVTGVTRSGQGPLPGDAAALDIQQAQETQRRAAQLPVAAPPLQPQPPTQGQPQPQPAPQPQPPSQAQPQRLPFTPGSQDDPLRNMPGRATVVPRGRPAPDDYAAIARQQFPMASQGPQREAYERQLRAQAAEQAGKERVEQLKTESKQGVERLKEEGRMARATMTQEERRARTNIMGQIADQRTAEAHFNTLYRQGNYAAAEILKDLRTKLLNDPKYQPNDEELGALGHLTGTIRGTPAATPTTPTTPATPATPQPKGPRSPPPTNAPPGGQWGQDKGGAWWYRAPNGQFFQ